MYIIVKHINLSQINNSNDLKISNNLESDRCDTCTHKCPKYEREIEQAKQMHIRNNELLMQFREEILGLTN